MRCVLAEDALRLLLAPAPARDPRVDALLQHIERHRSAREDLVVERAHVELRAEGALRPVAQIEHPQLPDLVPERLPPARPCNGRSRSALPARAGLSSRENSRPPAGATTSSRAARCPRRGGWRAEGPPADARTPGKGPRTRRSPPRRSAPSRAPTPRRRHWSGSAAGRAARRGSPARSRAACGGRGCPSWYAVVSTSRMLRCGRSPVLTFTCPGRLPSGVPVLYSAPAALFSRKASTGITSMRAFGNRPKSCGSFGSIQPMYLR